MKMSDLPSRIFIDGEPASDFVHERRRMEGKDEDAIVSRETMQRDRAKFVSLAYRRKKATEQ